MAVSRSLKRNNMTISKKDLRKKYRMIRNEISDDIISAESRTVCCSLCSSDSYRNASAVFTYLSYGSEMRTDELIWAAFCDQKIVAVPKLDGEKMSFYRITPDTKYNQSYYGIAEPLDSHEILPEECSKVLFILPGLCYDRHGGRIGYGGGYYDRYLSDHLACKQIEIVSLALSCQFYPGVIPMEAHDIRPDRIIYPKTI